MKDSVSNDMEEIEFAAFKSIINTRTLFASVITV